MKGQELKEAIMQELGFNDGLNGSIWARDIRIKASVDLSYILATHTFANDEIAFTSFANGLFLFVQKVAQYGDIGIGDTEHTMNAISSVIDFLMEIYENKNDVYRKRRCKEALLELINEHPLYDFHELTKDHEWNTLTS